MNSNNVSQLCDITTNIFDVPVFFINKHSEIIYENLNNKIMNPCYLNDKQLFFSSISFFNNRSLTYPLIITSNLLEKFLQIPVFENNDLTGHLIVGPFLLIPLTEKKILGIANDIPYKTSINAINDYYKSISLSTILKLKNISLVTFHLFNDILLSVDDIVLKNNSLDYSENKSDSQINNNSASKILFEKKHHDLMLERKFLDLITEGNSSKVTQFNDIDEGELGVLSSSSYIRSKKNGAISLITLGTRAAIDGGLNSEVALSLSDFFIQRIEEYHSMKEIDSILSECMLTLTKKVEEIRKNKYSKMILSCIDYINKNRYETISLTDLAGYVNSSPNYLSTLFKKEVGLTFSQYIQKVKINEAKFLLQHTDISISEIGSELNFSDQSHFSKTFKTVTEYTPKNFRDKIKLRTTI